jgi:hypothetical protein
VKLYAGLPETTQTIVRRIGITLLVLACIAALGLAVHRTRSGEETVDQTGGTGIVEQLIPANNSDVLQQAQIGIDLVPGWTGVLIVNGTEVPEDQLVRHPELYSFLFQPGKGQEIEQLPAGQNCAEALVWRVDQTRADARPVNWCFRVT